MKLPLVQELLPAPDLETAFGAFSQRAHCVLLDSALRLPRLGRYSFLAAEPFAWLECGGEASGSLDELDRLSHLLAAYRADRVPELPPFQGGAAGLFAYELGRSLERLPSPAYDEFQLPRLAVGLYDLVVAFDHLEDRAWVISQGFPELDPLARHVRARRRLEEARRLLDVATAGGDREGAQGGPHDQPERLPLDQLAPCQSVAHGKRAQLLSNFDQASYLQMVQRGVDYIHQGDIFQVNLAQRLLYPALDPSPQLYLRLRRRNAAPFAGYLDGGCFQVISASPERFVQVHERRVEARPIKGTRQRTFSPEANLFAGDDLLGSAKDRAENVMILDLLRNDLSRVCVPESVQVTELCRLETYPHVQHLVSAVQGMLTPGRSAIDLIRAAFPGGSITGAPKVRAMEIIAELEPVARGPYCGSLGYLGFDGSLDLSILIRTITASRGWWQLPVGGGIVAQSDPLAEYQETWHKARGLLQALDP